MGLSEIEIALLIGTYTYKNIDEYNRYNANLIDLFQTCFQFPS